MKRLKEFIIEKLNIKEGIGNIVGGIAKDVIKDIPIANVASQELMNDLNKLKNSPIWGKLKHGATVAKNSLKDMFSTDAIRKTFSSDYQKISQEQDDDKRDLLINSLRDGHIKEGWKDEDIAWWDLFWKKSNIKTAESKGDNAKKVQLENEYKQLSTKYPDIAKKVDEYFLNADDQLKKEESGKPEDQNKEGEKLNDQTQTPSGTDSQGQQEGSGQQNQ